MLCSRCNSKGFITTEYKDQTVIEPCNVCGNKVFMCNNDHPYVQFYSRSRMDCPLCAVKRLLQAREIEIRDLQKKVSI